jgi:hypothetical protein
MRGTGVGASGFFFSAAGGAGATGAGSGSGAVKRAMIIGGTLAARRAVSMKSGSPKSNSACSASDAAIA